MNKQKGFTIIELIVVIAIIAVLAGIVLVNVTSYINKGKDAAIKGNLAGFMTSAAAHYDTYGSYESLAASSTWPAVSAALAAAGSTGTGAVVIGCDAGGAACTSSSTKFCASAKLVTDTEQIFCVDSTGAKKQGTSACNTTTGACP